MASIMRGEEQPKASTPSTCTVTSAEPPKHATNIPLRASWRSIPATRAASAPKPAVPSQKAVPQLLPVKHITNILVWGRPTIIMGMQGTPVPRLPVPSQDDIVQLAARSPNSAAMSQRARSTGISGHRESTTWVEGEATESANRKPLTIADIQIELKEQQRRIELLLRLFAVEERKFLMDPSGEYNLEDENVKEKRKYEQAELRKSAHEIAQLQKRIENMAQVTPGTNDAGKTQASSQKAPRVDDGGTPELGYSRETNE